MIRRAQWFLINWPMVTSALQPDDAKRQEMVAIKERPAPLRRERRKKGTAKLKKGFLNDGTRFAQRATSSHDRASGSGSGGRGLRVLLYVRGVRGLAVLLQVLGENGASVW
jgi:hypothetical protein